MDGGSYNIVFVDVTARPCPELIEAARTTHRRIQDVHRAGRCRPSRRNRAPSNNHRDEPAARDAIRAVITPTP